MTEHEPTHEPVSWLRLERYHLGELPPEDAAEVARAIETDPETRACFEEILRPRLLNPRPDLPGLVPAREAPAMRAPTPLRRLGRSPWTGVVLAAAAAFLVYVGTRPGEVPEVAPTARAHVKGGDVAIELLRSRDDVVLRNPTTFLSDDRFKVLLTCPPAMPGPFEVLVFQGAEVTRPLAPTGPVACGNSVALPGAFTVSGAAPASVCVAWGDAAVRDTARLESLRGSVVCAPLLRGE